MSDQESEAPGKLPLDSCPIETVRYIYFNATKFWGNCYVADDNLEKAMAPHSSTLAWKIPWMEEPSRLQSMGVAKSWTRLTDFTFTFQSSSGQRTHVCVC